MPPAKECGLESGMDIISRKEAKERGLKRYFTGKPCKHGHVAERFVSAGHCIECLTLRDRLILPDEKAAKSRNWRQRNPQKYLLIAKRSRGKNRERRNAYQREWYNNHPEKERILADAARRARHSYSTNPGPARERARQRRIKDGGYIRGLNTKRMVQQALATPPWLTDDHKIKIELLYRKATELTQSTGVEHEVDHIEPIQGKDRCGLHVPWNLRVIPAVENRRKSNKPPEQPAV